MLKLPVSTRARQAQRPCDQFADAMHGFLLEKLPRNWADLCDLVTNKFRIINPNDFRS